METNFFGGLRCIKAVIPSMREHRHGCIINVTSVAGRIALAAQAHYAASKWAFEALSECLALTFQDVSPLLCNWLIPSAMTLVDFITAWLNCAYLTISRWTRSPSLCNR